MNSCRFMASVQNMSLQCHACQVVCLDGPPPACSQITPINLMVGINWTNIVQSLISAQGHFDYLGSQCNRESKKKGGYSCAQITAHMQSWLTWHMRES